MAEQWPSTIWVEPMTPHPATPTAGGEGDDWDWLPHLGPTAFVAHARLAQWLRLQPEGFPFDTLANAPRLGVKPARLRRSLDRLIRFGIAHRRGDIVQVAVRLPAAPRHAAATVSSAA
jgi:hypothetical protein